MHHFGSAWLIIIVRISILIAFWIHTSDDPFRALGACAIRLSKPLATQCQDQFFFVELCPFLLLCTKQRMRFFFVFFTFDLRWARLSCQGYRLLWSCPTCRPVLTLTTSLSFFFSSFFPFRIIISLCSKSNFGYFLFFFLFESCCELSSYWPCSWSPAQFRPVIRFRFWIRLHNSETRSKTMRQSNRCLCKSFRWPLASRWPHTVRAIDYWEIKKNSVLIKFIFPLI